MRRMQIKEYVSNSEKDEEICNRMTGSDKKCKERKKETVHEIFRQIRKR